VSVEGRKTSEEEPGVSFLLRRNGIWVSGDAGASKWNPTAREGVLAESFESADAALSGEYLKAEVTGMSGS
jgi:hypothetical protein